MWFEHHLSSVGVNRIIRPECLLNAGHGHEHASCYGPGDWALIGIRTFAIGFHQGKAPPLPVAYSDLMVERARRLMRRAGLHVERVAKAEGVQRAASGLEKGQHLIEILKRAHART